MTTARETIQAPIGTAGSAQQGIPSSLQGDPLPEQPEEIHHNDQSSRPCQKRPRRRQTLVSRSAWRSYAVEEQAFPQAARRYDCCDGENWNWENWLH